MQRKTKSFKQFNNNKNQPFSSCLKKPVDQKLSLVRYRFETYCGGPQYIVGPLEEKPMKLHGLHIWNPKLKDPWKRFVKIINHCKQLHIFNRSLLTDELPQRAVFLEVAVQELTLQ